MQAKFEEAFENRVYESIYHNQLLQRSTDISLLLLLVTNQVSISLVWYCAHITRTRVSYSLSLYLSSPQNAHLLR